LHAPLEQGYIITKRGADKPLAGQFADFMESEQGRNIMIKYGFALPGDNTGK
jgi:molybdate transport system substrate-binding protein